MCVVCVYVCVWGVCLCEWVCGGWCVVCVWVMCVFGMGLGYLCVCVGVRSEV